MTPEKTVDCLKLACLPCGTRQRQTFYNLLCEKWGEKVVCRKMERLADKKYIEYGVSPRTGWLTEKGKTMLAASIGVQRP